MRNAGANAMTDCEKKAKPPADRLELQSLHVHERDKPGVAHQQQAKHAHAKRAAKQDSERNHVPPQRIQQVAAGAQKEIGRAHHGGRKGNILGMVEHRAVPRPADCQRERGSGTGARPRDQARGCPGGADSGNADQGA